MALDIWAKLSEHLGDLIHFKCLIWRSDVGKYFPPPHTPCFPVEGTKDSHPLVFIAYSSMWDRPTYHLLLMDSIWKKWKDVISAIRVENIVTSLFSLTFPFALRWSKMLFKGLKSASSQKSTRNWGPPSNSQDEWSPADNHRSVLGGLLLQLRLSYYRNTYTWIPACRKPWRKRPSCLQAICSWAPCYLWKQEDFLSPVPVKKHSAAPIQECLLFLVTDGSSGAFYESEQYGKVSSFLKSWTASKSRAKKGRMPISPVFNLNFSSFIT